MKTKVFVISLLATQLSVALPTAVDANSPWTSAEAQQQQVVAVTQDQGLDTTQRLVIVEQSLNNINQMDLPGQIRQLQQDLQALRGQLDELQRQIALLQPAPAALPAATPAPAAPSQAQAAMSQTLNADLPAQEQAQRTYDAAFSLVRSGSYADAISAFQGFLQIYGNDNEYSANSYYWLGELYAYQHDYAKSNDALTQVVTQYPQSNKVPDAMLKLGIVNQKMGDQAKANDWFMKVIKQYPDSNAARMAKSYLK